MYLLHDTQKSRPIENLTRRMPYNHLMNPSVHLSVRGQLVKMAIALKQLGIFLFGILIDSDKI